jgi:tetratricopeptide (TPR) repeat protein
LNESNDIKSQANDAFAEGKYKQAIELYDKALQTCPRYLGYERAVLKSNAAACYLKTEEWKEAVKAAGKCLDLLDEAEGKKKEKKDKADAGSESGNEDDDNGGVEEEEEEEEEADEEIITPGAAKAEDTSSKARRKADIERIRAKALMRRGKARMEIGSWSSLQGAQEGMTASHCGLLCSGRCTN